MASNGWTQRQSNRSKVFKKENFIFGVCGSPRVSQLLRYKLTIPKRHIGQTLEDYIYTSFTDEVIKVLDQNNALQLKDGLRTFYGSFLFGFENKLYTMWDNFQSLDDVRGYDSAGSGEYHAMASLYSTEGLNITPENRLKKAIECANEFVISVDNKVDMVELVYDDTKDKLPTIKKKPLPPFSPDETRSI